VRVGLLIVATGKYLRAAELLIDSACAHLLDGHDFEPFVFTDQDVTGTRGAHVIPWRAGPWPDGTIQRYHAYWQHRARYEHLDFLLAIDADMRFVATVGEEIVSELTAVEHPGFVGKRGPYEERAESVAYVGPSEGERYYCGGVVGGRPAEFLGLARRLSRAVDTDRARGVIATWHDESHLNRQLATRPPAKVLSTAYCYPQGCAWFRPTEAAKIVALTKDHAEMRG